MYSLCLGLNDKLRIQFTLIVCNVSGQVPFWVGIVRMRITNRVYAFCLKFLLDSGFARNLDINS